MPSPPKTPQDKTKLINTMKDKVKLYLDDEYWTSDDYLYKWIEDKNYNVDKAEKALRKCLKWRLDNKIDGILNEDFSDLEKNVVYYMDGFDKDGRIVVTFPCNLCNLKSGLEKGNKERIIRCFRQIAERTATEIRIKCLKNPGSPSTYVTIIDCEGVDMTKATPEIINFCVSTATSLEDNYPGQNEITYVINASKGVKNMYNFAKTALRKNTTDRVKIFGTKRHKWESIVLSNIHSNQIRNRFGGTKEDKTEIEIPKQDLNIDFNNLKIKD